jgi:hypothetical protein
MADITGMFRDPNAIRQARIDDIAKQYQNTAQMGGSMNQLLGQVAAAGSNVGNLMAEGAAGMFGMTTPEEAKAAQIQSIVKGMNTSDPEHLAEIARQFNNLGYTEEAIKIMGLRKDAIDALNAEDDRKRKIKREVDGTWEWKVIDQIIDINGNRQSVYGWVNPVTQQVKGRSTNPNPEDSSPTAGSNEDVMAAREAFILKLNPSKTAEEQPKEQKYTGRKRTPSVRAQEEDNQPAGSLAPRMLGR